MKIHRLASVPSTNRYCEALDLAEVEDFTCYWALAQTAGIGQRGNHWEAEPGKNLTFSLVLHPTFLPADRQFKLTEALSLALCDCLKGLRDLKVKWPNDIYVGKRKICGTLVSTRLQGAQIASAICGIGLNVNQTVFPDWVPNPTSLGLLTGRQYELDPLLRRLLACIEARYNALKTGLDPEPEYLAHLMNLHVPARYIYNSEEVTATITGVDPHGRLLLTAADGRRLSCGMKEIQFL
jgi:BirA family biotin operon repressor/biotin-[acetyl-CoA-carboxylase] ligase